VVRCQAGDDDAFAALFERFGPRTFRYLERLVGDDAADVHQEVWLGVYRNIGRLASPAAFVSWLLKVTRHRAVDFLRRRRRERELFDDDAATNVDDLPANEQMPELETYNESVAAHLPVAIAALPAVHREILLLRYQEDLSYVEMAMVVGCSIGTVKSRLHHAKRRLQDLLPRA